MKIYCDSCCKQVELSKIVCKKTEHNDNPWSDIICPICYLVIATVEAENEGEYQMKRINNK